MTSQLEFESNDLDEVRNRSAAALIACFPDLALHLAQPCVTVPVIDNGKIIDIGIGNGRYYGGNGQEFCTNQVAAFCKNPLRIRLPVPGPEINVSDAVNLVVPELLKSCYKLGIDFNALPEFPINTPGFIVIFGIGLGYHIPLLQLHFPAHCLIVVDTHVEFLRQSLACIDWQTLLDRMQVNGQKLQLVISERQDATLKAIGRIFEMEGVMGLDGSGLFLHNNAQPLMEMYNSIWTIIQMSLQIRGFFEDECCMLQNAAANINRYDYHIVDAAPREPRHETVAIIGSGPSLQNDIADIKRLRQSCIIFSCGSALRACLINGITPDYHVEVENIPGIYENLVVTKKDFDLSNITLLASITVDPQVSGLFQEAFFYYRDTLISSLLFSDDGQIIDLTGPMVSNAAFRLAAALGFQKFLLFGVDCGSPTPNLDHVKGTAHDVIPGRFELFKQSSLDVLVPGNFGGAIHSHTLFMRSGMVLERLIELLGLEVNNCSGGILIRGATPIRAAEIPTSQRPLQSIRIKEKIKRQLIQYKKSSVFTTERVHRLDASISILFKAISSVLSTSRNDGGVIATWRAIDLEMSRLTAEGNPAVSLIDGTLRSIRQIAIPIAARLDDTKLQQAFDDHCRLLLKTLLQTLEEEIRVCATWLL